MGSTLNLSNAIGVDVQKSSYLTKLLDFVMSKANTKDINKAIEVIAKRTNISENSAYHKKLINGTELSCEDYDCIYNILYIQELSISDIKRYFNRISDSLNKLEENINISYMKSILSDIEKRVNKIDDIANPISMSTLSFNVGYISGMVRNIQKYILENKISVDSNVINDLICIDDTLDVYLNDRLTLSSKTPKEIAERKKKIEQYNSH